MIETVEQNPLNKNWVIKDTCESDRKRGNLKNALSASERVTKNNNSKTINNENVSDVEDKQMKGSESELLSEKGNMFSKIDNKDSEENICEIEGDGKLENGRTMEASESIDSHAISAINNLSWRYDPVGYNNCGSALEFDDSDVL